MRIPRGEATGEESSSSHYKDSDVGHQLRVRITVVNCVGQKEKELYGRNRRSCG